MIELLILAVITLIAGGIAVSYWDRIREAVAAWLRSNGLSESSLMEAWIQFDVVLSSVRAELRVRTAAGPALVTSETISLNEIEDAEIRRLLTRGEHVELDVLELVM